MCKGNFLLYKIVIIALSFFIIKHYFKLWYVKTINFESSSSYMYLICFSDGTRNFKTGGRGPGAVEFLRSGYCFDAP